MYVYELFEKINFEYFDMIKNDIAHEFYGELFNSINELKSSIKTFLDDTYEDLSDDDIEELFDDIPFGIKGGKYFINLNPANEDFDDDDNDKDNDIDIQNVNLNELYVKPTKENLDNIAEANFTDYKIRKIQYWDIKNDLGVDENDYFFKNVDDRKRIEELAKTITKNGWIEAIVVGTDDEHWIIEGQHRARALLLMGINKVPGHEIVDLSDE